MTIVDKAEHYVVQLFKDKLSSAFSYHNLEHTKRVVAAVNVISEAENLNEKDRELILLAAWFHDAGFCDSCTTHESVGMKLAEDFLRKENYPESDIEKIKSIINATSIKYIPQNPLENIIKDADTSHLGSTDFFEITEKLRQECKEVHHQKMTKSEWANINRMFLSKHRFYTQYAQENWEKQKQINLMKTQEEIEKKQQENTKKEKSNAEKILLNKKKLEKMESPERGVETMFRTTLNNHMHLSQIADSKANILLSVNAIIISVSLSTIVPKLDAPSNSHLIIPTFVLLFFSVASIIMAIISTRPKVSSGTFSRQDIENRKINLLFFGNFHKVSLDEYTWAMNEMMKDRKYLYDSMIKDLYYLGKVLDRKYRLLRTTYTIFTVGIIVSVLAYTLAFKEII